MHIVHFASELAPVAKVGGLADVLLGLPRELSWKKHDVDIIIPKYDCMNSYEVRDLAVFRKDLMSFYDGEWFSNTVWMGWVENLKVYFIEPHHPKHFFHRGCYYGCEDDFDRYLYFCRAAMEFLHKEQIQPEIIHLHDWQTAAIAPLYHEIFKGLGYNRPKLVFTIHNIEYQGQCSKEAIQKIGLDGNKMQSKELLGDNLGSSLNLIKGAIVYSNYVTTVSPNYAKEVQTSLGGRGLERTLIQYQHKFSGVLNGIDYSYWNPEIDRYLPAQYSSREMPASRGDHKTLDKKAYIKRLLRERLQLAADYRPIVGCITRLVPQKGIELIKHTMHRALEKNGQFILLGQSPIASINAEFHHLKELYQDHPHIYFELSSEEEFAHLLYAGADMLIVPSLFEPCGLTQMIALKYGTIPIVRKTGGLADTIFDVDFSGKPFEQTNGYSFDFPDTAGVNSALDRAFDCWFNNPERWRRLMITGMNIDYSWNKPSNGYLTIYKQVLAS